MLRQRLRLIMVTALALACVHSGGAASSLALFSDASAASGNRLTAGIWAQPDVYYLHNQPSPPGGNTTAQYDMSATTTAPSAGTLYRYDTDGADRAGRGISRTTSPGPGLATPFEYVNWFSPVLPSRVTVATAITVVIWTATNTTPANRTGSIVVYLLDCVSSSCTEIGSATYTGSYHASRTFYQTTFTIGASGYRLQAGHQVQVKVEAPDATSTADMLVAYDTLTYPSALSIG